MITDFSKKYAVVIEGLKQKIRQAQLQAALTLNAQMLAVYWEIGKTISEQENSEGWGTKVVESLAKDLKNEFPEMRGFSSRNLRYMRDFALAYPELAIMQTSPAKLENNIISYHIQENVILQAPLAKLENNVIGEHIRENVILQALLAKLTWYHHVAGEERVNHPCLKYSRRRFQAVPSLKKEGSCVARVLLAQ